MANVLSYFSAGLACDLYGDEGLIRSRILQYGSSIDVIFDQVKSRHDLSAVGLLFVGSVLENLQTAESDIDLLLIGPEVALQETSFVEDGATMETLGESRGRVQIERWSETQVNDAISRLEIFMDPQQGQVHQLSQAERRVLHRVVTGWQLNSSEVVARIRDRLPIDKLAAYNAASYARASGGKLLDVIGELKSENVQSAARMLLMAAETLGMSLLNIGGETNANPKWLIRLLDRHEIALRELPLQAIKRGLFIGHSESREKEAVQEIFKGIDDLYWDLRKQFGNLVESKGAAATKDLSGNESKPAYTAQPTAS